ncbi:AAA family ATPase, partial [Candidatus Woesearchaeota archaeon CG_4_10_14_0_8_um_filter_47_5]
ETDFIFIGTMNPGDRATEDLSDVFMDRFDCIQMGYPASAKVEQEIVKMRAAQLVPVPEALVGEIVLFIHALRKNKKLEKVPSVRATLGLVERAGARAHLEGKKEADIRDVEAVLVSVLAHRIRLKPSLDYVKSNEGFVREEFAAFFDQYLKTKGGGL